MEDNYLPIVGLEIHVELKTKSKMFCGCKNDPFHAPKPNMYTCPVCLGLPGALPVPNKKAVEWTMILGLALNCEIPFLSKFDRKNYFYPDLAKGYQISQYDQPLARNGYLVISSDPALAGESRNLNTLTFIKKDPSTSLGMTTGKRIRINRVHLEEDTGKLLHQTVNGKKVSLVDFNRSGVPLVEIVTEPDIHNSEEAKVFLKKLHQIVRYLTISDADMEKGSMRLEPNISVARVIPNSFRDPLHFTQNEGDSSAMPRNDSFKLPNYKVEVKNINSFNFVKKAIEYEVERHIALLENGETPKQETRGWEEKKGVTLPQRSKEEAHDYRYFPEPDIPPMKWEQSTIDELKSQIPELPDAMLIRFTKDYELSVQDVERLIENSETALYFEESIKRKTPSVKNKDIANWLLNKKIDIKKVSPEELVKQISASKVVVSVDEGELKTIIEKVISQNSKAVTDYKSGKASVIMFLVGQVMKELKGKGDAQMIREIISKKLQS